MADVVVWNASPRHGDVVLVVGWLLVVSASSTVVAPNNKSSSVVLVDPCSRPPCSNGSIMADPSDCRSFFVCDSINWQQKQCPLRSGSDDDDSSGPASSTKLYFDVQTATCVDESEVTCQPACRGEQGNQLKKSSLCPIGLQSSY